MQDAPRGRRGMWHVFLFFFSNPYPLKLIGRSLSVRANNALPSMLVKCSTMLGVAKLNERSRDQDGLRAKYRVVPMKTNKAAVDNVSEPPPPPLIHRQLSVYPPLWRDGSQTQTGKSPPPAGQCRDWRQIGRPRKPKPPFLLSSSS